MKSTKCILKIHMLKRVVQNNGDVCNKAHLLIKYGPLSQNCLYFISDLSIYKISSAFSYLHLYSNKYHEYSITSLFIRSRII